MSYNLINQFKKDNKITPKGILFIFMLFVIVVQSAIIIYSNLFELEHHLGFDASSAYLQAVEIWRCKSLVPSTFALTTTLGLDSPTPLAALFYGITGNIFLGFGIANIILDVVIAVLGKARDHGIRFLFLGNNHAFFHTVGIFLLHLHGKVESLQNLLSFIL